MKIAYIMSRFPLLSETFILREMIEVEKLGHTIHLYPLISKKQLLVHKEAQKWISRINYIPFMSKEIAMENVRVFFKIPSKYFSLIWNIFWGNISSFDFLAKGLYTLPKAVYMARRLQDDDIDHIHAHYATHPALMAWIIHQLTGITYSITIHSHDIYDCHAFLAPKLKDAVFLAPISNYNIEYLANLLGDWVREKCHVVRCGIDPSRFAVSQKNRENIFNILQIGTLHWKKDQVSLIKAVALLRDRDIPFQLTIIGEGEERSNLEAEIKREKLEDVVKLAGAKTQDEVAQLLPQANCYIQSSVSEGIPVAIMEALACELPVIATKITGIPELVIHEKTGLLVESGNIQGMADALQTIYLNPFQAKEMGKQGRAWVLNEFNLEKNTKKLVSYFNKQGTQISIN